MVRKIEILISDDNRLSRELIRAALEKYGVNFTDSTTGEETLSHVRSKKFDLIFLDFLMPDYNGLELAKMIRSQANESSHCHIIGISAATELTEEMCRAAGMNAFLSKPFNIAKLRQLVEAALGIGVANHNHA